MMSERRVVNCYIEPSQVNYSAWADQVDFKPEVKKACEEHKGGRDLFSTRSAKIIIIGQPGVGKTSMVLRYCRDIFERNYKTTIGVDFEVEKYQIMGVPFNIQIWDTAGAERFRGVTTAYFRGAQVVIVAFDLTNDETLYKTKEWLREAKEFCQTNFDVFLVATKKDLVADHVYEEMEKKAREFANEFSAEYWFTSSKSGENIEDFFTRVAIVAFEGVVTRELESMRASRANGQVASDSTLIRVQKPSASSTKSKKRACCAR